MQAKIKQDARYATLRLFFGREYNKVDWNEIPEGFEEQAAQNEFLDVRVAEDAGTPINAERGKVVTPAPPRAVHAAIDVPSLTETVTPTRKSKKSILSTSGNRNRHGSK